MSMLTNAVNVKDEKSAESRMHLCK